jgi:hypothetical protein
MTDLVVMLVLFYKDEMIELGIIPENVKWDNLDENQQKNVKEFLLKKIEERKNKK